MKGWKRHVIDLPVVGGAVLLLYRARVGFRYLWPSWRELGYWLVSSRETTNFTYDLTCLNRDYLAAFIAHIVRQPLAQVLAWFEELEGDTELRRHVRAVRDGSSGRRLLDAEPRFGRRLGWYALVRACKPKLVLETGVDKGLGSCVIAAALSRNAAEGFAGRYIGTDIDQRAGVLFSGRYAAHGKILFGDSIASLRALGETVDLFISDSDHSATYEEGEYRAVAPHLSPAAVVVGDNCHCSDRLLRFALESGRQFLFFSEEPSRHWYPGGGVGVAFPVSEEPHRP